MEKKVSYSSSFLHAAWRRAKPIVLLHLLLSELVKKVQLESRQLTPKVIYCMRPDIEKKKAGKQVFLLRVQQLWLQVDIYISCEYIEYIILENRCQILYSSVFFAKNIVLFVHVCRAEEVCILSLLASIMCRQTYSGSTGTQAPAETC